MAQAPGWRAAVGAAVRGVPSKPARDSKVTRRGWGGTGSSLPLRQTGAGCRLHSAARDLAALVTSETWFLLLNGEL